MVLERISSVVSVQCRCCDAWRNLDPSCPNFTSQVRWVGGCMCYASTGLFSFTHPPTSETSQCCVVFCCLSPCVTAPDMRSGDYVLCDFGLQLDIELHIRFISLIDCFTLCTAAHTIAPIDFTPVPGVAMCNAMSFQFSSKLRVAM